MSDDLLPRLRVALSDRYRIEAEIDTGGMATVYRARDLKHERTVAIKVLRPDLVEAVGADRFLKEIRTTANLSHPHILPLFDSGEAGGFLYYVMPFVDGESLADRLEREGQLPVEDAVQIAREVADALAYAHGKGVIHRDIKPANIMLEGGHALLADFGIAQAKAGAEVTKLTESGMSLGTPSYMSPEQIAGDKALAGRADQYALGCVLYEMLAGHPPFTGTGVETVLRQHLAVDAPRVTGARPTVPKAVADAVHRALAKSPADRFRNMGEFEKALAGATLPFLARIPLGRARTMVFGAAAVVVLAVVGVWALVFRGPGGRGDDGSPWQLDPNVIAVAPFVNRTGDPAFNDLGDWIAGSIRGRLERAGVGAPLPQSTVLGSLQGAGEDANVADLLSRELGAGTVITGFVYLRGDSLEVQTECIDAGTGRSLIITEPVQGLPGEETELVTRIQDRLAGGLALQLDPENPFKEVLSPPVNPEAYREWKQGWELSRSLETWSEAPAHYLKAWELDPTLFDAALDAANALSVVQNRNRERDSVMAVLEQLRAQMTELQLAKFESTKAYFAGDIEAVLRVTRRAYESNPLIWAYDLGHAALLRNRLLEAVEAFGKWEKGDGDYLEGFVGEWPVHYFNQYAEAMHRLGRHEKELQLALEGRRRSPDEPLIIETEILARIGLGQTEQALALLRESQRGGRTRLMADVADELSAHGFSEVATQLMEGEVGIFEADTFYTDNPNNRATVLMELGRNEEANVLAEQVLTEGMRGPGYQYGALAQWGITAARLGDTLEAEEAERLVEASGLNSRGYVRAQIRAALGDSEEAVRQLERAIYQEGWGFRFSIHRTPDLLKLKGYQPFEELMAPRG